MNPKLPVSVVMIARNEALRLPRSLGGVAEWVAEIVLVTNDCTDDTAEVARSLGAQVWEHPFQNLRDQKAAALAHATQPWVLLLDADEVVEAPLREEIAAFLSREPAADGAWLSRRLWFMGRWIRHGDAYPDRVLRLFRREKGSIVGALEHDRVEVAGPTVRFRNDLLHYSNDSIAAQVGKINFFCDFFVRRMAERGRTASVAAILFRPAWRFVRAYVLKAGFLDGFAGFYLAAFTAMTTFIRYARLREHTRKEGKG